MGRNAEKQRPTFITARGGGEPGNCLLGGGAPDRASVLPCILQHVHTSGRQPGQLLADAVIQSPGRDLVIRNAAHHEDCRPTEMIPDIATKQNVNYIGRMVPSVHPWGWKTSQEASRPLWDEVEADLQLSTSLHQAEVHGLCLHARNREAA